MSTLSGSISSNDTLVGTISSTGGLSGTLSSLGLRGYSSYEVAVQNGFTGTEEEWLESLKVKGDEGEAATISVGTVTSGETVSVTNSGTSSAAVFDFVLPKGDKGDQGEKGDTGDKGDRGEKGDTGEKGLPGIVVPANGMYSFTIVNNDLNIIYNDADEAPSLYIDSDGHLIFGEKEEETV